MQLIVSNLEDAKLALAYFEGQKAISLMVPEVNHPVKKNTTKAKSKVESLEIDPTLVDEFNVGLVIPASVEAEDEEPAPGLEDVRRALMGLKARTDAKAVKALLSKLGVDNIKDLKPSQYLEAIEAAA